MFGGLQRCFPAFDAQEDNLGRRGAQESAKVDRVGVSLHSADYPNLARLQEGAY
jgi:hypothetical protein